MITEAFEIEKIESISLLDIKKKFDENKNQPYYKQLLEYYFDYNKLNDLQNFRTFPNFFKKIKLNWILVYEKKQNSNILAGHAIMCKINYSNQNDLPENGWSGTTVKSFNDEGQKKDMNTYVGLFVHIEKNFREKNISKLLIEEMKNQAKKENKKLIIPLRPPTRFTSDYCSMKFSDYAKLKDKEGYHIDFWVKIHMKFGAKYLGFCDTSHQHKMDVKSFKKFFGKFSFNETGYYVVKILGGSHNIHYDKLKELITINQGCIWVEHSI